MAVSFSVSRCLILFDDLVRETVMVGGEDMVGAKKAT